MEKVPIDTKQIILQNPRAFLTKLRESRILDIYNFEKWKEIYLYFKIYHGITGEYLKNPPPNYFRATLYWSNLEETKENLRKNYEAIISRYDKCDIFIPKKYFDKLLDDSFSLKEHYFVKLSELCYQKNIKWNLKLLRKFKILSSEYLKHKHLTINLNTNIKLDFKIVEEFKNEIRWDDIIHFKELQWDLNKLIKYKDYIVFKNNDNYYERKVGSFSLLLNTKWDFETISSLCDYWNWKELCLNENIKWNIDLIEKFISKVDFDSLSLNSKINWSEKLIAYFEDYWNWENLSGNPALPWSLNLLKKYDNKWQWTVKYDWYYRTGGGQENENNYYPSISTNPGILWNVKMVEFGKSKIDFWRLARRGNLNLAMVKKIKKELYRKELIGWAFHGRRDNEETEKIYLTGWENLAKNELFKLNIESIQFLFNTQIEYTYYSGNLVSNKRGIYEAETIKLLEVFKNSKFTNEELIHYILASDKYRHFFINDDFINDEIWEKIIVPYTFRNKKRLLNNFKKSISGHK